MSNPNFVPLFSTNEIYRNTDNTICLTDDLDAIEAAIEELEESQVNPSQFASANHTHSELCAHGWIVEWSDYDDSSNSANNYQFVHTPIYKRNVLGTWNGQSVAFTIGTYVSNDGATIQNSIKHLFVYDNKLVGDSVNNTGTINRDVTIRAVYEF